MQVVRLPQRIRTIEGTLGYQWSLGSCLLLGSGRGGIQRMQQDFSCACIVVGTALAELL